MNLFVSIVAFNLFWAVLNLYNWYPVLRRSVLPRPPRHQAGWRTRTSPR